MKLLKSKKEKKKKDGVIGWELQTECLTRPNYPAQPCLSREAPGRAQRYRTVAFNQLSLYIAFNQIPGITVDKVVARSQFPSPHLLRKRWQGPPNPPAIYNPHFLVGNPRHGRDATCVQPRRVGSSGRVCCPHITDKRGKNILFFSFTGCCRGRRAGRHCLSQLAAKPVFLPRCLGRGWDTRGSRSAGITGLGFGPRCKKLLGYYIKLLAVLTMAFAGNQRDLEHKIGP